MNRAHERFLELAAASIDFDLSATERRELSDHLAGCPSCARGLDEMRADARTIQSLPMRELTFDRAPIVLGHLLEGQPWNAMPRWVVLAALLALMLIGLIVVGSELLRAPDITVVDPRPRATTTQSAAPPSVASAIPGPAAAGRWVSVGPLSVARGGHTGTLLLDGRVLVAGGNGQEAGGTAELYDPATGAWSSQIAMTDTREGASAIRLTDGTVMHVGGFGLSGAIASTDLFNGGAWLRGPTLLEAHGGRPGLAELPDGSVLVIGGNAGGARGEVVSVASGEVRFTGAMSGTRWGHTTTMLVDGRVLVVGGVIEGSGALATAEIFDPATETWLPAASMRQGRSDHTASLLPDGRVLVAGGTSTGGNQFSSVEIYDPATDSWSAGPDMLGERRNHAAAQLADGRLLVAGGRQLPNGDLATSEVFDPATETWIAGPTMEAARSDLALVVLLDGSVLAIGGEQENAITSGVELLGADQLP